MCDLNNIVDDSLSITDGETIICESEMLKAMDVIVSALCKCNPCCHCGSLLFLSSYSNCSTKICTGFSSMETNAIDLKLPTQCVEWSPLAFQHLSGNLTHSHKIRTLPSFSTSHHPYLWQIYSTVSLRLHWCQVYYAHTGTDDINSMHNSSGTCVDVIVRFVIRSWPAGVWTSNFRSTDSEQSTNA